MNRAAATVAGTAVLATGAAWAGGLFGGPGPLGADTAEAALLPFGSCKELLGHVEEHRWALEPRPVAMEGDVVALDAAAGAAGTSVTEASADLGPAVGAGETGTNVQETSVDEPDMAKLSDGTLLVVARSGLEAFDVSGAEPEALSRVELPGRRRGYDLYGLPATPQLLVADGRALVISQTQGPGFAQETTLSEIDATDPEALELVRTLEIEGAYVSARMVGSTVHLATAATPKYPKGRERDSEPETGASGATGPQPPSGDPRWLPRATITDAATGESATEPLFGCEDVSYPERFAGLGLLSLLAIDLSEGLAPSDAETVMTQGEVVYASETSFYVATQSIVAPVENRIAEMIAPEAPASTRTMIHRFSTGDPLDPEYSASGEVAGRLIGQFALSEHDGVLRVASTRGDAWARGEAESESLVSVLAERHGELAEIGRAGGLGRGEEIYAVRFIGDLGFVVTFEQTDPLYALDLSNPSDPRLTGELKIPGYSAYLHPTGSGRLLGIGQSGTGSGQITGAQASLFDVGDLTSPERLDELKLAGGRWGSSATEYDHHAFLYSPERTLAVVPVESYGHGGFRGAVALRVSGGELTELARFSDGGRGGIQRMLVAGERLLTVSGAGVTARDLETFERTGSAGFAG